MSSIASSRGNASSSRKAVPAPQPPPAQHHRRTKAAVAEVANNTAVAATVDCGDKRQYQRKARRDADSSDDDDDEKDSDQGGMSDSDSSSGSDSDEEMNAQQQLAEQQQQLQQQQLQQQQLAEQQQLAAIAAQKAAEAAAISAEKEISVEFGFDNMSLKEIHDLCGEKAMVLQMHQNVMDQFPVGRNYALSGATITGRHNEFPVRLNIDVINVDVDHNNDWTKAGKNSHLSVNAGVKDGTVTKHLLSSQVRHPQHILKRMGNYTEKSLRKNITATSTIATNENGVSTESHTVQVPLDHPVIAMLKSQDENFVTKEISTLPGLDAAMTHAVIEASLFDSKTTELEDLLKKRAKLCNPGKIAVSISRDLPAQVKSGGSRITNPWLSTIGIKDYGNKDTLTKALEAKCNFAVVLKLKYFDSSNAK